MAISLFLVVPICFVLYNLIYRIKYKKNNYTKIDKKTYKNIIII